MINRDHIEDKVKNWTEFLFNDGRSVGMFYCISQDLYVSLVELYNFSQEDSYTETGVVLNPTQAAQCLTELRRTESFVRGLDLAIKQKQSEGKSPVRVFYAGCGPFATQILPLTYRYSPEELQVTLLDYHKEATDAATELLGFLGKMDFIDQVIVHDAVTYKLPPETHPDIMVTETLQRALTRECHVPIVQNLMSQLPEDVLLIPEEIRVSGLWTEISAGSDYRAQIKEQDVEMDTVILLNAETARSGELVKTVVGKGPATPTQTFCLQTEIDVFGPWKITRNECGLTCPHPMPDIEITPGEVLEFEYESATIPD